MWSTCVHLLTIDTDVTGRDMRSLQERIRHETVFFSEEGKQCTETDDAPAPSPIFQLITGPDTDDELIIIEYSTQEDRPNRRHTVATTIDALRPEQLPKPEEFINPENPPVRIFFWMPTIDDASALSNLILIGEALSLLLREKRTYAEHRVLLPTPGA